MKVVTRTATATAFADEEFTELVEIAGSTRNNVIPPSTGSIVKIDVAVGSPTAADFIGLIRVSGEGFAEQTMTAVAFSGATSGALMQRASIPLGTGFPITSDVTSLNIQYAQCSGGALTQDVSVSLYFE